MSRRFELIFGYWNSAGYPKKVAKLSGKKRSNNEIADLVIIQYDLKLWHFTLHNTEVDGKLTRYQLQANSLEYIAAEDRKRVPEVLQTPLPDFAMLSSLYRLQAIPIWAGADDERNFYTTMKESELRRYSDNLADLRGKQYDRNTSGLLEFCLVPETASSALNELKESLRGKLYLWTLYTETLPWILSFIMFPTLLLREE